MARSGLDDKDRKIIALLSENAWATHAEIGEAVFLSPSSVQRRIDRLRAGGIITGARAIVNPTAARKKLRIYLMLELYNDGHEGLERIAKDLRDEDGVLEVDLLAGIYDLLVVCEFEDMEQFSDFAMKKLNKNKNIKHCFTLTRLKKLL